MTEQKLHPVDYARVFEGDPIGERILEDLIARYGGNPYKPGGLDAQRETDFRAGRLEVVNFLLRKINQAHEPATSAEGQTDERPDE